MADCETVFFASAGAVTALMVILTAVIVAEFFKRPVKRGAE